MELFSTWLDIVDLVPLLIDKETRAFKVKNKGQIYGAILTADNHIRAMLRKYYTNFDASVPWFKPAVNDNLNTDPEVCLLPLITLITPTTQVVTLAIGPSLDVTQFDVMGDLTGVHPRGATTADYTVANEFTIPTTAWASGTYSKGDFIYIRTYRVDPIITEISAKLAAADILNNVFTEQSPNQSDTSNKYQNEAEATLKALMNQETFLQKEPTAVDLTPEAVHYDINRLGEDETEYLGEEWYEHHHHHHH